MTLLNLPSLPEPFKKRKKIIKNPKTLQKRIDLLNAKIKFFEDQYKFDSNTMIKYYESDKIMDNTMGEWVNAFNEKNYYESTKNRESIANELVDEWIKKTS